MFRITVELHERVEIKDAVALYNQMTRLLAKSIGLVNVQDCELSNGYASLQTYHSTPQLDYEIDKFNEKKQAEHDKQLERLRNGIAAGMGVASNETEDAKH